MSVVLLSHDPAALREALKNQPSATVEAEYGVEVVEGSLVTLAHHGPRSDQPCPCLGEAIVVPSETIIGVSHIDLDTLGGVARLFGWKPFDEGFWALAAHVDLNGPHRAAEYHSYTLFRKDLEAWWAWSSANRAPRPDEGEVIDVTQYVKEALDVLREIEMGVASRFDAGKAWRMAQFNLCRLSKPRALYNGVLFRTKPGGKFVNHLYKHGGVVYSVIVGWEPGDNPSNGAVTLSFEGEDERDACALLQEFFGPLAGGHKGIGGSPRGMTVTRAMALAFANWLPKY
jgi:hypothetical protein